MSPKMPPDVTQPAQVRAARRHLRAADPLMATLIKQAGTFGLTLNPNPFEMLAHSIISQQISVGAARAIRLRLATAVAPNPLAPANIAALTVEDLRAVGLSRQKAAYLHDLSARVADGRIDLDLLSQLPDAEIIKTLTTVHGIGVWTAQMFLMFCLGRPDVLPVDDYGIRAAMRNLYHLPDLPGRAQAVEIGAPWHPHATHACWYLWQSLELPKK